MKRGVFPLILLALCWVGNGSAATVNNLYQAQLLVGAQTGTPENRQLAEGLQQVLIKVSGRRDLLGRPLIQNQISAAGDYLLSYSYRETREVIQTAGQSELAQKLTLEFVPMTVDGLLQQAGIQVLGAQRSTLLLWLASDQQGKQEYLGTESPFYPKLNQLAVQRGLPLQVPLLDLQDQSALPMSDLWGLFTDSVEDASLRYRPDAVLAARMHHQADGQVSIDWVLLDRGAPQRFTSQGGAEAALLDMLHNATDRLFAAGGQQSYSQYVSGLELRVANIMDFNDYVQLTELLKALPVVAAVNPERVGVGEVVLRLQLEGSESQLQQAVSLEPRLQLQDILRAADGSQVFSYRWQE